MRHLCFLLLIAAMVFGCEVKQSPLPENLDQLRQSEPLTESFGVSYYYSDKAKQKALLKAPHVIERITAANHENEVIFDNGIEIVFYDSTEIEESRLIANRAKLLKNQGFAEAKGNVVVKNNKGDRLETETLRWFRDKNILSTNDFVKIYTQKDVIYGDSLVANTSFTEYKIYRIKGILSLKEDKK